VELQRLQIRPLPGVRRPMVAKTVARSWRKSDGNIAKESVQCVNGANERCNGPTPRVGSPNPESNQTVTAKGAGCHRADSRARHLHRQIMKATPYPFLLAIRSKNVQRTPSLGGFSDSSNESRQRSQTRVLVEDTPG
jgi:hypothetical protein